MLESLLYIQASHYESYSVVPIASIYLGYYSQEEPLEHYIPWKNLFIIAKMVWT